MPLRLNISNPLNIKNWDELVLGTKDYSFFHSSAWARVLYEEYQYKPFYFTLISNKNLQVLVSLMEISSIFTGRRGVSLPFTDYCKPIVSGEIPMDDVMNCVIMKGEKRGWKSIELRDVNIFSENTTCYKYYFTHTLNLLIEKDKMISSFKSSTRRNIHNAINEGVKVHIKKTLLAVQQYYKLHVMTRKKHGLPPQPISFFEKIYRYIIAENYGEVFLAEYDNKNIAGAIYFHFGNKVVFKYGASEDKYLHLRPNNLIMWEAIKWYAQNGLSSISLGRTAPDNLGLRKYKNSWGTIEKTIPYYKFVLKKGEYIKYHSTKYGIFNKFFCITPSPLLRLAGRILYKHIG